MRGLAPSMPRVSRSSETHQSLGLCLHVAWVRWVGSSASQRALLGVADGQDKPAKTEMCPSQLAILYCFSSGEQINFSGFSLRPSFLPKSFPEGFGLKLERSYESALCYELRSNSLWNCPFLSLGTYISIREFLNDLPHTQNWAFRHMVQVSGSSSR